LHKTILYIAMSLDGLTARAASSLCTRMPPPAYRPARPGRQTCLGRQRYLGVRRRCARAGLHPGRLYRPIPHHSHPHPARAGRTSISQRWAVPPAAASVRSVRGQHDRADLRAQI